MRVLKERHLLLFRLGFCCDATGTTLMSRSTSGPFIFSLHGVTGLLAIPLMLFHAVWGTGVTGGIPNPKPASTGCPSPSGRSGSCRTSPA